MANLHGTSWGATPTTLGDSGGVVTWSIAPGGLSTALFPSNPGVSVDPDSALSVDYQALIGAAFAEWSLYGNVEFMQIEDGGGDAGDGFIADIRIFFGAIPGGSLGLAFFPSSGPLAGAGDILLDIDPFYSSSSEDFYELALHEIGHSLGLDHVAQSTQSVMTPVLSQSSLQPDDIAGIQAVYGVQDNAPATYTMPSNDITLNILQSPDNLVVRANVFDNYINATSKDEVIWGNDGFDTIEGLGGDDTLMGENHADLLAGGDGDDSLDGGAGFDVLQGGAGNDTLDAGDDPDRLFGGDGDDLLYAGASRSGTVDGSFGEAGNDTIYGGLGYDLLDGGAGNDYLDGGNQADNLYGRGGDDTLLGGQGLDRLFAGTGDDSLMGGIGRDGLFGQQGDDTMWGGTETDRLFGGVGNDELYGEAGDDLLYGGAGFDTIDGGTGDDRLRGNFNADVFVFADGHGNDTVVDFADDNQFEKIDLSGVTAIIDLADLKANHATQFSGYVLIDTGTGSSITLNGVTLSALDDSDFLF